MPRHLPGPVSLAAHFAPTIPLSVPRNGFHALASWSLLGGPKLGPPHRDLPRPPAAEIFWNVSDSTALVIRLHVTLAALVGTVA